VTEDACVVVVAGVGAGVGDGVGSGLDGGGWHSEQSAHFLDFFLALFEPRL